MESARGLFITTGLSLAALGATACGSATGASDIAVVPGNATNSVAPEVLVLDNYQIVHKLFETENELWGGAYANGDVLVIKFANQNKDAALATLTTSGARGPVRLVETDTTYGELQRAVDAMQTVAHQRDDLVGWGPDYKQSSLTIDAAGDAPGLVDDIEAAGIDVPVDIRTGQPRPHSNGS